MDDEIILGGNPVTDSLPAQAHTSAMRKQAEILQMPLESYISEGQGQANKIIGEVMERLFALLPEKKANEPDFYLNDRSPCWIVRLYAPNKNKEFGFDVKVGGDSPIDHLEFYVRNTGWGRRIATPDPS